MTNQPADMSSPQVPPAGNSSPPPPPPPPVSPPPVTEQDWIDQATSQGVPPDYLPPGAQPGEQGPSSLLPEPAEPGSTDNGYGPNGSARVIDTSSERATGLDKCPRCGSTEVTLRPETGMLICHFCRFEWSEKTLDQKFGFDSPVADLAGTVMGSGASNIQESAEDVLSLKCGACGAEVVVNTAEATHSRCHWCRNVLSVNEQLPNGAVPDGLLPFAVTKEDAVKRITEFVGKRKFFAHPKFVHEFAPTEVVGVYMPYLLVDANAHVELQGEGEIQTARYTRKSGDSEQTYYDADQYKIGRSFDIIVDDLTLESSGQRADIDTSRNTNNIINAIQPFDVKSAVTYSANYMRGFTAERRDLDIAGLRPMSYDRLLSIGRSQAGKTITKYGRGVRWEQEHLTVTGTRWVSLYLPVWLYSYYQSSGNGTGLTHYVAVNGRTGETMGSVPVRQGRLIGMATVIGVVGTVIGGILAIAFG